MNSSTNVSRNPTVDDEKLSPAKVFTANNTPSFVNSFEGLPMPTENFVRNYGRRMRHMAYEVLDGDHKSGEKNIDYVVGTIKDNGIAFLAHIVGECKFRTVAELAGARISAHDITIEKLPAPYTPPTRLPPGKMAVYIFHYGPMCLKVGKAGRRSSPRYTSQHYNPKSARGTLAGSMLADQASYDDAGFDEITVGQWIKEHIDRVNFLLDDRQGMPVLTLLEAFLQCRLRPKYEGFKGQQNS